MSRLVVEFYRIPKPLIGYFNAKSLFETFFETDEFFTERLNLFITALFGKTEKCM